MELQSDVPTTRETQRAYKEASIKAGESSDQNMMYLKYSVDTVTGITFKSREHSHLSGTKQRKASKGC